jgi:hypothetical protein
MIGAVVVYRVEDTFKAAFAVEHYPGLYQNTERSGRA